MNTPDRTPVLVGIGTASRREEDFFKALEPIDLMLEAVNAAGSDCGRAEALAGVQYIAVPRGRWAYRNPAGMIAQAIGARHAVTTLATVGVLQQTLIGEACSRIAQGDAHSALVTGADAGYRMLRAKIAGQHAGERDPADDGIVEPDITLAPTDELRHPVEKRAGMRMPVGLYAIMESAWRARRGWSVDVHRDRLAQLGERFSQVAASNPHAWQRKAMTAQAIRDASERNPMQAFPYTRLHCSTWNVDQSAALLFCSAERARSLGIPRSRWVFPLASSESSHMVPVCARADLAACPGARIAGRAALDAAGLETDDIDLIDLYSCFPLAVQVYADALGLPESRRLTLTGGMAFAGGPYNNYCFQAICRAAELLRSGKGRTALISCVSGVLTKQGFGIWSLDEPKNGFANIDCTEAVAQQFSTLEVIEDYTGEATVAGYTVLHGRGEMPRGVALVDTPQGRRALTTTEDAGLVARLQQQEFVGRRVQVAQNTLLA